MADRILATTGPRFAEELLAANIGDGIGWNDSAITVMDEVSSADRATLLAVIAAHDPAALASPRAEVVEREQVVASIDAELARNRLNESSARAALEQARTLLTR